nr:hypothetical protein CFP56_65185 [Quercus suber]
MKQSHPDDRQHAAATGSYLRSLRSLTWLEGGAKHTYRQPHAQRNPIKATGRKVESKSSLRTAGDRADRSESTRAMPIPIVTCALTSPIESLSQHVSAADIGKCSFCKRMNKCSPGSRSGAAYPHASASSHTARHATPEN